MDIRTQPKSPKAAIEGVISNWANSNLELFDVAVVIGVSSYPKDRVVDVLPLCVQRDDDGLLKEKPVITGCPVMLPGSTTGEGVIQFPPKIGDKVVIGYPKESIEEFTYSSSIDPYTPVDSMKFQGHQAIVLGSIEQANGVGIELSSENFEIKFQGSTISISPNNTVVVTNGTSTVTLNGGEVDINGATITSSGNIITGGGVDIEAFKLEYDAHIHVHGTPNTGPPFVEES